MTNGIAADGRHNITVLSVDIDKKPPTNVHYILMENVYTITYGIEEGKEAPAIDLIGLARNSQTTSEELSMYGDWCYVQCEGK